MRKTDLVFDRRALAIGSFILLFSLLFIDDDSRAFDIISSTSSAMIGGVLGLLREEAEADNDVIRNHYTYDESINEDDLGYK